MKKFFGIIAIVAVVAAISWNLSQSQNEIELSDLALTNVEALARGEGPQTYYCCGNTGTCAKGTNSETGKEFIIHGRPSTNPC